MRRRSRAAATYSLRHIPAAQERAAGIWLLSTLLPDLFDELSVPQNLLFGELNDSVWPVFRRFSSTSGRLWRWTPDTKLIPAYRVGKRDLGTATAFLCDLSERLRNRIQLSSDALRAHVSATEEAFGADVDYGQAVVVSVNVVEIAV